MEGTSDAKRHNNGNRAMRQEAQMSDAYRQFLKAKAPTVQAVGIEPRAMSEHLMDYQADVVAFALRQGRAAEFLGPASTSVTMTGSGFSIRGRLARCLWMKAASLNRLPAPPRAA